MERGSAGFMGTAKGGVALLGKSGNSQTTPTMAAKEYQAFILSEDGHVVGPPVLLVCENDDEAKAQAQRLAKTNVVSLWEGTRRIARLSPERN